MAAGQPSLPGIPATGRPLPGIRPAARCGSHAGSVVAAGTRPSGWGYEGPGMRGVYSHVSDAIRAERTTAWHGQSRWAALLRDRAQPASGSTVSVSDALADG